MENELIEEEEEDHSEVVVVDSVVAEVEGAQTVRALWLTSPSSKSFIKLLCVGHARVARPARNNESNKPSSADDTNENAQRTNKNQTQSVSTAEQTATDNVGTSKQARNLGSGVWGDVNKKHVKQGWGPSKPQQPSAKQPTTASQTPSSAPAPSKPKQVPTPASQPTPKPATTMKTSWAQIVKYACYS